LVCWRFILKFASLIRPLGTRHNEQENKLAIYKESAPNAGGYIGAKAPLRAFVHGATGYSISAVVPLHLGRKNHLSTGSKRLSTLGCVGKKRSKYWHSSHALHMMLLKVKKGIYLSFEASHTPPSIPVCAFTAKLSIGLHTGAKKAVVMGPLVCCMILSLPFIRSVLLLAQTQVRILTPGEGMHM
jgi:hypothetical protein